MKLEDEESINKVCSEFITDPEYVKKYIKHKTNLKSKQIRDKEKAKSRYERSQKSYSDYKWDELVKSEDKLNTLLVSELNKYLTYHKLSKEGKQGTKLEGL